MAQDTWNFPCYQCRGATYPDNTKGMFFAINASQPFTETFTGVMSFFIRDGWFTPGNGGNHVMSIGSRNRAFNGIGINVTDASGDFKLEIRAWDGGSSTTRVLIELGDEDGVSWLQENKWYQFGFSVDNSNASWVMNGSTTPKQTITTNAPGALNLDLAGQDRLFMHSGNAFHSFQLSQMIGRSTGWSTLLFGAGILDTTYLDFSSQTVIDRIWDSNGDFRPPGEDGSLWLGDAYSDITPDIYMLDGSPRRDNGSFSATWAGVNGGASGMTSCPGGLRKQYE